MTLEEFAIHLNKSPSSFYLDGARYHAAKFEDGKLLIQDKFANPWIDVTERAREIRDLVGRSALTHGEKKA